MSSKTGNIRRHYKKKSQARGKNERNEQLVISKTRKLTSFRCSDDSVIIAEVGNTETNKQGRKHTTIYRIQ